MSEEKEENIHEALIIRAHEQMNTEYKGLYIRDLTPSEKAASPLSQSVRCPKCKEMTDENDPCCGRVSLEDFRPAQEELNKLIKGFKNV